MQLRRIEVWKTGLLPVLVALAGLNMSCSSEAVAAPTGVVVYEQREGDFHTYRIPSLTVTNSGAILAL